MKCVVCGKESKGKLCSSCAIERVRIARIRKFELEFCRKCGLARSGSNWVNFEKAVEIGLTKNLSLHEDFKLESIKIVDKIATLYGELYDERISLDLPFDFKIKYVSCPKCSKKSGGYYEAIVQLRAESRSLKKEEIEMAKKIVMGLEEKRKGERDFLLKVEKVENGIDFYLGSRDMGKIVAKKLSEEFGAKISESKKLHTRMDGQEVYRFTYLVQICGEAFDVLIKDENFYVLKDARSHKAVEIFTGKSKTIKDAKIVAKSKDLRWGVITSVEEDFAEVMCEDGKVIVVPKPFAAEVGREVKIFEYMGKFYAFVV